MQHFMADRVVSTLGDKGVSKSWFSASEDTACVISSSDYGRDLSVFKQIHGIGNEFYWVGEK